MKEIAPLNDQMFENEDLLTKIISISCCSIVLFLKRNLPHTNDNSLIKILLSISFLSHLIEIFLIYFSSKFSLKNEEFIYELWSFADIGLFNTQLIMFSWGMIEKYWRFDRWEFRWIGLIYCFIWYLLTIFIPFCSEINPKGNSCLFENFFIQNIDLILHQILPIFIILIFSIFLISSSGKWLSITIVYLIFYIPWIVVSVLIQIESFEEYSMKFLPHVYEFTKYFSIIFSIICK